MRRGQAQYCAACGGPQGEDDASGTCIYCNRELLPVGHPDPTSATRCGSCQAAVQGGSSFCTRCGSPLAHRPATASETPCPSCGETMHQLGLAPSEEFQEGLPLQECRQCGGVWLPSLSFEALVARARRDAPDHPQQPPPRRVMARKQAKIVYRDCPECGHHMHRKNFGDISGVVVDRCHAHGYFLDAGELEDVTDFIAAGGLVFTDRRRKAERAKDGGKSERERLADILIAQSGFNPWQYADQPQTRSDPIGDFLAWARRRLFNRRR